MTALGKDGRVEFRFYRPEASEARLAGDFNGWGHDWPMQRDAQGWWVAKVALEPGEYRFRYVADGTWYTDFASNGVEAGKFGMNSVLVVRKSSAARARPKLRVA